MTLHATAIMRTTILVLTPAMLLGQIKTRNAVHAGVWSAWPPSSP